MKLTSSEFPDGGTIPFKYSGQGEGISPPLAWVDAPLDTKSFALIMDDPDVPLTTFTHWVIFNIPPNASTLPEAVPNDESLPDGSRQGKNTLMHTGYTGPMPPTKKPHRYHFKLFALDKMLDLEPRASKKELLEEIDGHTLAQTQIVGVYTKY